MPKKIDPEVQARAVRLVADHLSEYPSLTAASAVVAKQVGVGRETVRRWVVQAQIDGKQLGGRCTSVVNRVVRSTMVRTAAGRSSGRRPSGREHSAIVGLSWTLADHYVGRDVRPGLSPWRVREARAEPARYADMRPIRV